MTPEIQETIRQRVLTNEGAGLRYCFTCNDWDDDTDCFPGDHSRHCGHELKPLGLEIAPEYRLICTNRLETFVAFIQTHAPMGAR